CGNWLQVAAMSPRGPSLAKVAISGLKLARNRKPTTSANATRSTTSPGPRVTPGADDEPGFCGAGEGRMSAGDDALSRFGSQAELSRQPQRGSRNVHPLNAHPSTVSPVPTPGAQSHVRTPWRSECREPRSHAA